MSWTIDQLEACVASLDGRELEGVRVLAAVRAYQSGEPSGTRLRWAAVSLEVNRRGCNEGVWGLTRMRCQDFALRAWIIGHLGPGPGVWDPQVLAADTLAALTLDPARAEVLAADWRSLPIEQISDLRRHKNLTAHGDQIIGHLAPGTVTERLAAWVEIRRRLP